MVQVYEMADADAQRLVGGVLAGIDGLTVELAVSGSGQFLVVNCSTAAQAVAVQRFVTAVDPSAIVIHTSFNARTPVEVNVA
jgi:hypothetical protein